MQRAVFARQDSWPSYSSLRFHTRRRLIVFMYLLILFLLLFSILYSYHSLTSLKSTQVRSSSSSARIMYVVRTSSKFYQNRLILYFANMDLIRFKKHVYFVY